MRTPWVNGANMVVTAARVVFLGLHFHKSDMEFF